MLRLVQIWGLWVVANLAVLVAEGFQYLGLYAESVAPVALADACIAKADEHFDALAIEAAYRKADRYCRCDETSGSSSCPVHRSGE